MTLISADYRDYAGAIGVHTRFSDGAGTVNEIASHAAAAALDYVLITDHNSTGAIDRKLEGWYEKVLLIAGIELTPPGNRDHYLALDLTHPIQAMEDPASFLFEVQLQGGYGFVCHPTEEGSRRFQVAGSPWTFDTSQVGGVEIWNYMSSWVEAASSLPTALLNLRQPHRVNQPRSSDLDFWDALTLQRPTPGIGSVDAHAFPYSSALTGKVEILPYPVVFRTVRTHILCEPFSRQWEQDKQKIVAALKAGRCYVSFDWYDSPRGFNFYCAVRGLGTFSMGEEVKFSRHETSLRFRIPKQNVQIRVLKDGKRYARLESQSGRAVMPVIDPGVYRAEIWYRGRLWILTNPIYIRG